MKFPSLTAGMFAAMAFCILLSGCVGHTETIRVGKLKPGEKKAFVSFLDNTAREGGLRRQFPAEFISSHNKFFYERSYEAIDYKKQKMEMWAEWDPYYESFKLNFPSNGELESIAGRVNSFAVSKYGTERVDRFCPPPWIKLFEFAP